MVDALVPFRDAFLTAFDGGAPAGDALAAAAAAATAAADGTCGLRPLKGRARPLAEKSLGHPDPGAVSFALIASTDFSTHRTPAQEPGSPTSEPAQQGAKA